MKYIIKNASILNYHDNRYCIKKNDILVDQNKIIDIKKIHYYGDIHVVDLKGRILLPMLFNIHCHLGENAFRCIKGNNWTIKKYLEYTENYHKQYSAVETENMWKKSASETIDYNIKNGIMGFCAARSAEIASEYHMDTMAGYPLMKSEKLRRFSDLGIHGFTDYYSRWNGEYCSVGVFLHSLYANDFSALQLTAEMLRGGAEFLTIHISEDKWTRMLELKMFGDEPIKILKRYHLLNERTILVHGGFLSDNELKIIAESGATIAVCPISNKFLNTQIVDIYKLKSFGIPWCIATDGLGTGRTFSMFQQAKTLKKCFDALTYEELFAAMTRIPGTLYSRNHYQGNILPGTTPLFLVIERDSADSEELLCDLISGKIGYQVFKEMKM